MVTPSAKKRQKMPKMLNTLAKMSLKNGVFLCMVTEGTNGLRSD